jgi:hypothetical protein
MEVKAVTAVQDNLCELVIDYTPTQRYKNYTYCTISSLLGRRIPPQIEQIRAPSLQSPSIETSLVGGSSTSC